MNIDFKLPPPATKIFVYYLISYANPGAAYPPEVEISPITEDTFCQNF